MSTTNRASNQGASQLASKLHAAGFRKSDTQLALQGIYNALRLDPELQRYRTNANPFPQRRVARS